MENYKDIWIKGQVDRQVDGVMGWIEIEVGMIGQIDRFIIGQIDKYMMCPGIVLLYKDANDFGQKCSGFIGWNNSQIDR